MAKLADRFTQLSVAPNADGLLQNLNPEDVTRLNISVITSLERGTENGEPTVGIWCDLPDDKVLFAETTLKLFLLAARALATAHGVEL